MPFQVPTYSQPASGWALADWVDASWSSDPADTSGTITLPVPQLDSATQWLVTRAVISTTSTTPTTLRLYTNGPSVQNLRSGSNAGNYDEADYPRGLIVRPASQLVAVWLGASAGARAVLALQAEVYRMVTG